MKNDISRWLLFILSGMFGFALANMILNSPLNISQLFDYSAFITCKYGIEISGYIGWAYLLGIAFLSTLIFSVYYYFKHFQTSKVNNKENLTNTNSSSLNKILFNVNDEKSKVKEEHQNNINQKSSKEKAAYEKIDTPKIIEEKQDIEVKDYDSPDFAPEYNHVLDDDLISEYFQNTQAENKEANDEAGVKVDIGEKENKDIVAELTEKFEEKLIGLYNKTNSQIETYLQKLGELQQQITEYREDLAKEGESSKVLDKSESEESLKVKKLKKLEQMKEMEREANIIKDKILEEQRLENKSSNAQYLPKHMKRETSNFS
jgi:predicted Zn-dependent protease with MMP-like domain